jgi:hypothetical protein
MSLALSLTYIAFQAIAEDDIEVGHNTAGQLVVSIGFTPPLGLPVSVFPGFPGFATGEVGLHSAAADEPTNDFFQLSAAADLRFILLSQDAGMEVLNDHGSAYMAPGESFFIGTAPFDTHPFWNLTNGTAGKTYSLAVKIHDMNSVYSDSAPVTFEFTPDLPVLSIVAADHNRVTISWTPATAGFLLQSSPATKPLVWTNAPTGETNPVSLNITPGAKLFRVAR